MENSPEMFSYVLVPLYTLVALIATWLIFNQIIQEGAENRIKKFEGQYQVLVKKIGITFRTFARSSEPTPGVDTIVLFEGPTVQAELTPSQALYFLKTVQNGAADIAYLERNSKWEYCPLL